MFYFGMGIFFILYGRINADEGWYLYASRLVYEGQRPYQDFAYTQTPLLPYVYGILQTIFAPSIYWGRITTFALTTIAMIFSLAIAWRYAGRKACAITALLWATFTLGIYYQSITKTYALMTLLFTLTFFTLTVRIDANWKAVFVTLLVLLATLTRLSALFFALPILIYALKTANNKYRIASIVLCMMALLWMVFLSFPNVNAVQWNLMTHHTEQWGGISFIAKILDIIKYRIPALLIVYLAYFLFFTTLVVVGFKQIVDYFRQHRAMFVYLGSLFLFAASHFYTGGFHVEYFVTSIFCIFPVVGILFVDVFQRKQGVARVLLLSTSLSALILGVFMGGLSFVDMDVEKGPVAQIESLAQVVADNTDATDEIYALEGLWIALEADRHTLPNMSMSQFSFSYEETEDVESLHLVNGEITLTYLSNKMPEIVILTDLDWRLLQDADEYAQIVAALEKNYELIIEASDFGQSDENVEIYLLRGAN